MCCRAAPLVACVAGAAPTCRARTARQLLRFPPAGHPPRPRHASHLPWRSAACKLSPARGFGGGCMNGGSWRELSAGPPQCERAPGALPRSCGLCECLPGRQAGWRGRASRVVERGHSRAKQRGCALPSLTCRQCSTCCAAPVRLGQDCRVECRRAEFRLINSCDARTERGRTCAAAHQPLAVKSNSARKEEHALQSRSQLRSL